MTGRGAWIVRIGATVLSLVAVTALIMRTSDAAFTASTDNPGNSWAAGQVHLSDDDSGTAMFSATNMVPGDSLTKCILVTYDGTTPNPTLVKLYATAATTTGLAPYLDLVIDQGSTGSSASCTGFTVSSTIYSGTLADFAATKTNYATGVGSWDPFATPQTKVYRFKVTLNAATPNSAQSATASAGFTWEVSS